MKNKVKLAFVTNSRSDYTTMFPVIAAAQREKDVVSFVIAGGMHLKREFGFTYKQIETDGFTIDKKLDYFVRDSDSRKGLAKSLARGVLQFTEALTEIKPDYVVVSGDRIENLALFAATTSLGLPVAHLCGGDITEGAFDDQVRHAMTKLSHLHFVSMSEHALRVLQMGEEPWRIVITGDAALDTLAHFKPMSREKLEKHFGIPRKKKFAVSTFHPVTLGGDDFVKQSRNMLDALAKVRSEWDLSLVFTYPNIDPGHEELIQQLKDFKRRHSEVILIESCTREQYYSLMSQCAFIIGNSSSGIWEAPTVQTPCINIGTRQQGRKRAGNVIDVSGNNLMEIEKSIRKVFSSAFQKSLKNVVNPYGSGNAAKKTIQILKNTPVNDRLMMKRFFHVGLKEKILIQVGIK